PDRLVVVWDVARGAEVRRLRGPHPVINALAFSADGRLLAVTSSPPNGAHEVRVWDLAGRRSVTAFAAQTGMTAALAFSPDARQLAASAEDSLVRIWDGTPARE